MSRCRSSSCVPSGWDAGPVSGVPLSRDADPIPMSQWVRMNLWYPSPIRWGCRSNPHVLVGWDAGLAPLSHQVGMQDQNLVSHHVRVQAWHLCPISLGCRPSTQLLQDAHWEQGQRHTPKSRKPPWSCISHCSARSSPASPNLSSC